jgi:hypothetical protein
MSKPREGVEEIPLPPKGDGSNEKPTLVDRNSRDSRVEQLSS